jgi:hypothetical protein
MLSLEIKQSAQKELDALDDTLFTRWPTIPGPQDARS